MLLAQSHLVGPAAGHRSRTNRLYDDWGKPELARHYR
jgi:hypothetical protein